MTARLGKSVLYGCPFPQLHWRYAAAHCICPRRSSIGDRFARCRCRFPNFREHGFTPLHEAVSQGHLEVVRLLLSQ